MDVEEQRTVSLTGQRRGTMFVYIAREDGRLPGWHSDGDSG